MPRKGFRLPIEINPVYVELILKILVFEYVGMPVYASSPELQHALKKGRNTLDKQLRFLRSEGYLLVVPSKGRKTCYVVNKDHVRTTIFSHVKSSYEIEKQRYNTWDELMTYA